VDHDGRTAAQLDRRMVILARCFAVLVALLGGDRVTAEIDVFERERSVRGCRRRVRTV
jgi:hypothetical protein